VTTVNTHEQKRRGAYLLAAEQIAMLIAEGAQRIAAATNTTTNKRTEGTGTDQ
jgi:hypothetical protein